MTDFERAVQRIHAEANRSPEEIAEMRDAILNLIPTVPVVPFATAASRHDWRLRVAFWLDDHAPRLAPHWWAYRARWRATR